MRSGDRPSSRILIVSRRYPAIASVSLPCELESIGSAFTSAMFAAAICPRAAVSRFIVPRFIALASDFYVSISKHARVSSLSLNKTSFHSERYFNFAKISTRNCARARVCESTRARVPYGCTVANFIDYRPCIEFVKAARFVSSDNRRPSPMLPHVAVKFLPSRPPRERTCDLVVRFCKLDELEPP